MSTQAGHMPYINPPNPDNAIHQAQWATTPKIADLIENLDAALRKEYGSQYSFMVHAHRKMLACHCFYWGRTEPVAAKDGD